MHDRDEEQLDRVAHLPRVELRRRRSLGPARVVHEDVDAAVRLDRGVDETLEVVRLRDVTGDGQAAEAGRFPLEQLSAAREHRNVRALALERLGDAEADAGGGATDDRSAAVETEIHG